MAGYQGRANDLALACTGIGAFGMSVHVRKHLHLDVGAVQESIAGGGGGLISRCILETLRKVPAYTPRVDFLPYTSQAGRLLDF